MSERKVLVLREVHEIFEEYRPVKSKIYEAGIYTPTNTKSDFCIIAIKDKKISLRQYDMDPSKDEWIEVCDVDRCPLCGTDECSFVYIRKNEVIGCDCCVHPVDIWEVPDEIDADNGG